MPKCVKCNNFFPPNYTDIIPDREVDGVTGEYPQHCVFCRDGIKFVTREESPNSGNFNIKYTKEECINDYKAFVDKMKNMSGDKEKLKKTIKDNPFGLR